MINTKAIVLIKILYTHTHLGKKINLLRRLTQMQSKTQSERQKKKTISIVIHVIHIKKPFGKESNSMFSGTWKMCSFFFFFSLLCFIYATDYLIIVCRSNVIVCSTFQNADTHIESLNRPENQIINRT